MPRERRYLRVVVSGDPVRRWLPLISVAAGPLRYSATARQVIDLAELEARRLSHNYIGTEHILLGLAAQNTNQRAGVLRSLGIDVRGVRQQVEEIIGFGPRPVSGAIPLTPRATATLRLARAEALRTGSDRIGSEHILLGLIREGEGVAAQILVRMGAWDPGRVRRQLLPGAR